MDQKIILELCKNRKFAGIAFLSIGAGILLLALLQDSGYGTGKWAITLMPLFGVFAGMWGAYHSALKLIRKNASNN